MFFPITTFSALGTKSLRGGHRNGRKRESLARGLDGSGLPILVAGRDNFIKSPYGGTPSINDAWGRTIRI